jgi:hypothetical protein
MPSVGDFETYLAGLVSETKALADAHPESALTSARKTAESICRELYGAKLGDPGKAMLDEMLKKLVSAKIIPQRVAVPFGTIQAYGNFGTHAQGDHGRADRSYVAPCLAALDEVVAWYYRDQLGKEPPGSTAPPRPRALMMVATVGAISFAAAGGAFYIMMSRSTPKPPEPPTVAAPAPVPPTPVEAPPTVPVVSAAPPVAPSSGGRVAIDLTVHAVVGGVKRVLAPGEKLRKDDEVAFEVRPSATAYVYIAAKSNGQLAVLFPDPHITVENPLPAGKSVLIPPEGSFSLDDKDLGPQDVYVIASNHEIAELSGALSAVRTQDGAKPADADAAQAKAQLALAKAAKREGDCGARGLHLTGGGEDPCRMLKRGLVLTPKKEAAHASSSLSFQSDEGDDTLVGTFAYEHAP